MRNRVDKLCDGEINGPGCYILPECEIMFYKNHGWREFFHQFLDLHAGVNVDIVQRFIPDIQVRLLAKASGDQHFFLLTR